MFSKTAEYALKAMTCLAEHGGRIMSSHEIAREAAVPANYLTKILYELSCAELIVGRRGASGGYRLNRPLGEIRLLEVLRAVSDLSRVSCPQVKPGRKPCSLHSVLDDAARAAISVLDRTTLQDVVQRSGAALCHSS
jgi:Rrf2 family protein